MRHIITRYAMLYMHTRYGNGLTYTHQLRRLAHLERVTKMYN